MTPKEKAKELVERFDFINHPLNGSYTMTQYQSKQCALIAVDEILDVVSSDESAIIVELQYWQEVKQEIEKL